MDMRLYKNDQNPKATKKENKKEKLLVKNCLAAQYPKRTVSMERKAEKNRKEKNEGSMNLK
jgi:hypothetical protein